MEQEYNHFLKDSSKLFIHHLTIIGMTNFLRSNLLDKSLHNLHYTLKDLKDNLNIQMHYKLSNLTHIISILNH